MKTSASAGSHLVRVSPDAAALAEDAATCLAHWCEQAVAERGVFTLALSGGETPLRLFALLARPEWRARLDWAHTRVFWVDERCVATHHPRSNFGAARKVLFETVRPEGLFPYFCMPASGNTPSPDDFAEAARAYGVCLAEQAGNGSEAFPSLDCVLLGMGADGHTASLFPGTTALEVNDRPATCVWVAAQNEYRLTLTLPMLNAARRCVFMLSGQAKAAMVRELLHPTAEKRYPAQQVQPRGERLLLLDAEAAGLEGRETEKGSTCRHEEGEA